MIRVSKSILFIILIFITNTIKIYDIDSSIPLRFDKSLDAQASISKEIVEETNEEIFAVTALSNNTVQRIF